MISVHESVSGGSHPGTCHVFRGRIGVTCPSLFSHSLFIFFQISGVFIDHSFSMMFSTLYHFVYMFVIGSSLSPRLHKSFKSRLHNPLSWTSHLRSLVPLFWVPSTIFIHSSFQDRFCHIHKQLPVSGNAAQLRSVSLWGNQGVLTC